MFNSLGESIRGARVLDAFAGSGAVGLEALSRGAESAVFVERDRVAQRVIAENISILGVEEKIYCNKNNDSKLAGKCEFNRGI